MHEHLAGFHVGSAREREGGEIPRQRSLTTLPRKCVENAALR